MKFDLASDLHCDMNTPYASLRPWRQGEPKYYAWHIDRKSDVLVIAGDTHNDIYEAVQIIQEASQYYDEVIFTDGNHEHYNNYIYEARHRPLSSVVKDMDYLRDLAARHERLTYLDGDTTKLIDDTLFIGACGWYDFTMAVGVHPKEQLREWKQKSNDPRCCRFGKHNRPEKLARRQAEQLVQHVRAAQDDDKIAEIVVITHTVPHLKGLIQDRSHPWYPLNGAYGNGFMSRLWAADQASKIKVWCFGHTHERKDFVAEGIRFVCNPRGYQARRFDGVLQIDTNEELIGSAFGPIES